MNLDARMMVPISEANIDFFRIMHLADSCGRVVILKNSNPKILADRSGAGITDLRFDR